MRNHRIGNWRIVLLTAGTLALILTPGCNTTNPTPVATAPSIAPAQARRIAELQSDYDQMPDATQKEIAKGSIVRGQSPEMVYIALGRPDRIITSADGRVTTWTYRNYFPALAAAAQPKTTRKSTVSSAQRVQINDPLQETMQAWNNNLLKHSMIFSHDPVERDPLKTYRPEQNVVPKAPGQSWADYARYIRNQELAAAISPNAAKLVDDKARVDYREALAVSPIQDPDSVKLDVVFLGPQVSDAFINESVSAFATQP